MPPPPRLSQEDALALMFGGRQQVSAAEWQRGFAQPGAAAALGWPQGQAPQLFAALAGGTGAVHIARARRGLTARRIFDLVDVRRGGWISAWDLYAALASNQEVRKELRVPPELAQSLVRQMDVDQQGRVLLLPFVRWFAQQGEHSYDTRGEVVQRVITRLSVARRGGVTLPQLEAVLQAEPQAQLELGWPARHAGLLWRILAPDGRRAVGEEELRVFLLLMCLFNRIDVSRDGYVDAEEFGSALAGDSALQRELRVQARDAQGHFRAIDAQGSGVISFAEFYRYFRDRAQPGPAAGSPPPPRRNAQQYARPEDAYEVLRTLGEGSYGVVYLTRRRADGLELIMKEPKMSAVEAEDVRREADLMRRLKHPHIIRFVEAFPHSRTGALVIVTEYAAGGDLRRRIARGQLPQEQVMRWFGELCEGLQYLHERCIMHRDIKPDNIFLTAGDSVKLGDLGLGKQLRRGPQDEPSYTHTVLRGPRGVPSYMAPEQVQGQPHTVAIDVWAAGCVLYEMSTGRVAFRSPDAVLGRPPQDAPAYASGVIASVLVPQNRRPTIAAVLALVPRAGVAWQPRDLGLMASYVADRAGPRQRGTAVAHPQQGAPGYR
eukprot:TRINITY_DN12857_c0_g1_i1.p1 TRINITY_DN12857_c0_g1~~TRINITY_DN12857_c0_g1_i1.p1  ORF type:complete len:634 (+),score=224.78 TRINITY_DN12857_c0_g1_i1:91-1902(+)